MEEVGTQMIISKANLSLQHQEVSSQQAVTLNSPKTLGETLNDRILLKGEATIKEKHNSNIILIK